MSRIPIKLTRRLALASSVAALGAVSLSSMLRAQSVPPGTLGVPTGYTTLYSDPSYVNAAPGAGWTHPYASPSAMCTSPGCAENPV